MTTTIYTFDESGVFLGAVEHDPLLPLPRCTLTPPPATEGDQVAVFTGTAWAVMTGYPPAPPFDRATAALQIDEAVAAIYGRFTRFQLEYTEREAQAQAYKDAGYTGPVPPRVAEFATPAGMPAQAATDLILQQAVNLRAAQGALSALRMRKYEVLRAATDEQAQSAALEILAAIEAIGRTVQ